MKKFSNYILKHWKSILAVFVFIVLVLISITVFSYQRIEPYTNKIVKIESAEKTRVGLVLGAGLAPNGKPYDELKARLDVAAEALAQNKVDKLLLSGDNRFVDYNEPEAMKNYLKKTHMVDDSQMFLDYAGRSTYESCERAHKIFGLKNTIIFSAESHLPRALYLCKNFGIEAVGVSSGVEANNSTRRELMARVKAVYNVNIRGENTVLGEPIPIL